MTERIKGPQSYFPSIEAKYGKPIDYWLGLLVEVSDLPHMQMVNLLKDQHAMGHGHANAIVAYFRAKNSGS